MAAWRMLMVLSQAMENDQHFPRVRDVPDGVDVSTSTAVAQRILANGKILFAAVFITGNDVEMERCRLVHFALRKKVPTALIMCPRGYGYMVARNEPDYAVGVPAQSCDTRLSVLLGSIADFHQYNDRMFGKPCYFCPPTADWNASALQDVADTLRSVAHPDRSRRILC